ncbi:ribonuclease P protein subunit [Sulfodiicoccus acidiphilus]|uniref:ribonuclease P protein subunit n=1 Tax=Sulfodiicoccus acidiphilus TaxID=1670455 RepID=UPI000F81B662
MKGCDFNGKWLEVLGHSDPTLRGVQGTVIWEGERTFRVLANGHTKTLMKYPGFFVLEDGHSRLKIDGASLQSKISNRIVRRRCRN